jgi:hypothetical protein
LSGTNQNDVSMFRILNLEPVNFSAFTVFTGAFGIPDTVLSLFDSLGVGIYLNDDISGANTMSCLPSAGALNPCPTTGAILAPGIYYLAISRSANYPLDGSSNEIFNPVSSTDLVGPSSSSPVAGWDGGAFTSPDFDLVTYDIVLSGTVPEPATWLLTAGAPRVSPAKSASLNFARRHPFASQKSEKSGTPHALRYLRPSLSSGSIIGSPRSSFRWRYGS